MALPQDTTESGTVPKIITALALASLVAFPLVACTSPGGPDCEATPAGSQSEAIEASGPHGEQPKVTMSNPFNVTTTERSVVINGDGVRAVNGDVVTVKYTGYNATSGEILDLGGGSTWTTTPFPLEPLEEGLPGLYKSLNCSQAGARIVSVIPPSELFGEDGPRLSGGAIGVDDTAVFVFDILSVEKAPSAEATPAPEPSGDPASLPTPAAWVDNIPTVDLSDAVPVVTIPKTSAPTELELKVIKEGTGAQVADQNSSVTVDYQGISWENDTIFDQSYTRGGPSSFPVNGVIQGFAAAMIGQKVGSTLLVTIPPKYGYGTAESSSHALAGQTLVFLIQIRDVLNAE